MILAPISGVPDFPIEEPSVKLALWLTNFLLIWALRYPYRPAEWAFSDCRHRRRTDAGPVLLVHKPGERHALRRWDRTRLEDPRQSRVCQSLSQPMGGTD
jgi:hypothetical protein